MTKRLRPIAANARFAQKMITGTVPLTTVARLDCPFDLPQKFKFEGKELDRTFGLDNYDIHARSYFAMAPMWDIPDQLAHKYYGISPYAYCAGDPVNRGDYDGREIVINEEQYYTKILNTPEEWVNTALNMDQSSSQFQTSVQADIQRAKNDSPKLKEYIEQIEQSPQKVTIGYTSKDNKTSYPNQSKYFSNVPTDVNISYNPDLLETELGNDRAPYLGLLNELGHAWAAIQGLQDANSVLIYDGNYGGPYGEASPTEPIAFEFENMARAAEGFPLRINYGGIPLSSYKKVNCY